ncbi:MAG TPA: DUF2071 domain-containing protein [Gemmatimonadaceae bacterium]|nr:DUF2071 domain-containing protein [Gemmatimonadaceae bacterium]
MRLTRIFLTADWRHLAMLNFEVDPAVLVPHLPKGTELDDFAGRHFVSLVAFLFLDTHVLSIPAFFHQNFEEMNLRFYVRRSVGTETHHGVVFLREIIPFPLVAAAARLTYNEPYRTVPMRHSIAEANGQLQSVAYSLGGPRDRCLFTLQVNGASQEMRPGSEEEFLSERHWGYTKQRDGGTIEYYVDHARWHIWPDVAYQLAGPLREFYDEPFASIISGVPESAFIANGSAVAVHLPERIA